MKALVIAPQHNTPGKRDATGAFLPEARGFCVAHGLPSAQVRLFNNMMPMAARATQVLEWIKQEQPDSIDTVALFGHGWKDGIQLGFRIDNVRRLAQALADVCTLSPRIILYCCDTARDGDDARADDLLPAPGGEGGFADGLRDALGHCGIGATIYAHSTAGHTSTNPYVRRFDADAMGGGHYLIRPYSELWAPWARALQTTSLRFRFAFMAQAGIEQELRAADEGVA